MVHWCVRVVVNGGAVVLGQQAAIPKSWKHLGFSRIQNQLNYKLFAQDLVDSC